MTKIKNIITNPACIFLLATWFLGSCLPEPDFTNTPNISNPTVTFLADPNSGNQDTLQITVKFTDGDGNMGLADSDTCYPFSRFMCDQCQNSAEPNNCDPNAFNPNFFNFMVELLLKENGQYVPVIFPEGFSLNGRFRPFGNQANQPVEGVITYSQPLFFDRLLSPGDTFAVKFYVKDRALNHSQTLQSNDIIFP